MVAELPLVDPSKVEERRNRISSITKELQGYFSFEERLVKTSSLVAAMRYRINESKTVIPERQLHGMIAADLEKDVYDMEQKLSGELERLRATFSILTQSFTTATQSFQLDIAVSSESATKSTNRLLTGVALLDILIATSISIEIALAFGASAAISLGVGALAGGIFGVLLKFFIH